MTSKLAFDLQQKSGQPDWNYIVIDPRDSYLIVAMNADADKTFAFLILKRQKSDWREPDHIIFAAIHQKNFDVNSTEAGQVVSVRQVPRTTVKLPLFDGRVFGLVARIDRVTYGQCVSIDDKRTAELTLNIRRKRPETSKQGSVVQFRCR